MKSQDEMGTKLFLERRTGFRNSHETKDCIPTLITPFPSFPFPAFVTSGQVMYRLAIALCRMLAWTYFVNPRMEVLNVTQHPENWSIQARWRLVGLPFPVLLLRYYKDKHELYR